MTQRFVDNQLTTLKGEKKHIEGLVTNITEKSTNKIEVFTNEINYDL